MSIYRKEFDSFGEIAVEDKYYWGASTERSLKFFKIGVEKIPLNVIYAFAAQKKAAAIANKRLGLLASNLADAIADSSQKIIDGLMDEHFQLSVWQTGSGTQTNMNLNEVIANLANEQLGGKKGAKSPVHPNDHVNKGQSSNDSFPTVMNIATCIEVSSHLLPALKNFSQALDCKSAEFANLVKIGRTHLQDATPITLGQEFSAFSAQIVYNYQRISKALEDVFYLAQGGTAVGTGANSHKNFATFFIEELNKITNLAFKSAANKFEALASHDGLVNLSGALNTLAASLMKIANDIRLLSSGPRCGFAELHLPENEPGSSIMPGKVNPTQAEALAMICAQVMGNHVTISIAGASGHLQLNVFKPVIIYNLLQSIKLLSDGVQSFMTHCLVGIEANVDRIDELKNKSLMLVTALSPKIGYDKAAMIAKCAFKENLTLKEASNKLGFISQEEFDQLVKAEHMLHADES